jgi:TrmH family RNA methyltransferase
MNVKDVIKLTQKKFRREMGLCIVEGDKLVAELKDRAQAVFTRETLGKDFEKITDLENSRGVLAVVKIPTPKGVTFPFIVLDGVQDTGNVGTILRTARAFGFNTVFCINCADVYSQKVIRAASGMQFDMNIHEQSPEEFAEFYKFQLAATQLYIADMNGGEICEKCNKNYGIVFGAEGQGVSQFMRAFPHEIISVPMEKGVESLNVAVACGIILFAFKKGVL